ncbi:MAG: hypothetical protein JOZ69_20450 [Myxococcales bacterium]|nr:hypothetical protein [Myxococcales bacterium]
MAPSGLDPSLLFEALRRREGGHDGGGGGGMLRRLQAAVARDPRATWEQDLLRALAADDPALRDALVNEQLGEYDWLARRWGRVPRVCASIATSGGFLFASVALLRGLADTEPDTGATLLAAVNALSFGIAATSFCVAVHLRTQSIVRERLATVDRLVGAVLDGPGPLDESDRTARG